MDVSFLPSSSSSIEFMHAYMRSRCCNPGCYRFDVALEQGLGELLVDYMVEVCKCSKGALDSGQC